MYHNAKGWVKVAGSYQVVTMLRWGSGADAGGATFGHRSLCLLAELGRKAHRYLRSGTSHQTNGGLASEPDQSHLGVPTMGVMVVADGQVGFTEDSSSFVIGEGCSDGD